MYAPQYAHYVHDEAHIRIDLLGILCQCFVAAALPCNPQSHCSSVVCVTHYKVQPTVPVGGIVGGVTAPVVVLIAIIIALSVVVSISCCCTLQSNSNNSKFHSDLPLREGMYNIIQAAL